MDRQDLEAYLRTQTVPMSEAPLADADLLAFAALMYAEFERFAHFGDETVSTPLSELPHYGTFIEYVEHDYNPKDMLLFLEALVESPRFADIPLQRFRCIFDEERIVQFAAGCFPLPDGRVVVTYRGTNAQLAGWQESFDFMWQAEGPGEAEALRYLEEAASAYPDAPLVLCGHSKGGGYAEHAALFASNELLGRIRRVVSLDGPAPFRLGEIACPEFGDFDSLLEARYAQLPFPLVRYVFPSMVGLMFERRNPDIFIFTETVDESTPHNVCSVRIVDGRIVSRHPSDKEIRDGMLISRWVQRMDLQQRRFICSFVIEACRAAGITVDLGDVPAMIKALGRAFLMASPLKRGQLIRILKRLADASKAEALL